MTLGTGNILLIGSILLFVSIIVGKAGSRMGMPVLLLFLPILCGPRKASCVSA